MGVFYHFVSNNLEQHPISGIVVRVGRQLSFFVIVKLNAFGDGGTKMSRKQYFYLKIPFFFFVDVSRQTEMLTYTQQDLKYKFRFRIFFA